MTNNKPTILILVNPQGKAKQVDYDAFKMAAYAKEQHHKKWINKLWNDRKNPWTNNIIRKTLTLLKQIRNRKIDPRCE